MEHKCLGVREEKKRACSSLFSHRCKNEEWESGREGKGKVTVLSLRPGAASPAPQRVSLEQQLTRGPPAHSLQRSKRNGTRATRTVAPSAPLALGGSFPETASCLPSETHGPSCMQPEPCAFSLSIRPQHYSSPRNSG